MITVTPGNFHGIMVRPVYNFENGVAAVE